MTLWNNIALAFKGGGGSLRPPLGRSYIGTYGGAALSGDAPFSYEGRVREAYVENAIAQRAVRIVAEGVGGAPASRCWKRSRRICCCMAMAMSRLSAAAMAGRMSFMRYARTG